MSGGGPTPTVEAILSWLDEKPGLSRCIAAARRLDQVRGDDPGALTPRSVLVLRNFTIEPLEPVWKVAGARAGLGLDIRYSGYDPGPGDELDGLMSFRPDAVFVALRLEELAPALSRDFLVPGRPPADALADGIVDRVMSLVDAVGRGHRVATFVHNFVPPVQAAGGLADSQDPRGQLNLVRAMNVRLTEQIAAMDGAHVVDVEHLFARIGLDQAYDHRGDRLGDAPLSQPGLRALARSHVRHLLALRGPAVKCLVVDCDNTLWGGVIGEDGITGIALGDRGPGRPFVDLQRRLLDLRHRGLLLAIASKNEDADVRAVLRDHPDCVLREGDFSAVRINWDEKPDNIVAIAKELDLGLEHLAFLDDNPVECEWVRTRLPEVRVIQWQPKEEGAEILDELGWFDSLVVTDEDRTRTELYRAEACRRAARDEGINHDDYLRSLAMRVTVGRAAREHLPRLAQLTQRTNQFNLTTRRYDVPALEALIADRDAEVVWVDLADRFGASGIVGCGILRVDGSTATIDTLLVSCRVIGRQVEAVLVRRLADMAAGKGATVLVGEYVPSARNAQVADLYGRLGFEGPEAGGGSQVWRYPLGGTSFGVPDWFEVAGDPVDGQ